MFKKNVLLIIHEISHLSIKNTKYLQVVALQILTVARMSHYKLIV